MMSEAERDEPSRAAREHLCQALAETFRAVGHQLCCPVCGSAMMRACEACDRDILVPVGERCESCGLLYPWAPERVRSMSRRRRDWKLGSPLPADQIYPPPPPNQPQEAAADHDRLLLIDCDLTALLVDAIVSPDDSDGQMHSHLASAIKLQAGDEVEEQSVDSGPHRPGTAWFTTAGALKDLKGIVHVAVPEGDGRSEFGDAKRCVRSAYMEAKKQSLESLGIAAFGPGVRIDSDEGVNIERWVPAVAGEIVQCMREGAGCGSPALAVLIVVKGQRGHFEEMVELVRGEVGPAATEGLGEGPSCASTISPPSPSPDADGGDGGDAWSGAKRAASRLRARGRRGR